MPNSNYDEIGNEYYDERHITSRNFDDATRAAITDLGLDYSQGKVLELGAGRGRANEFLKIDSNRVVQLDSSEVMFNLPNREDCLLKVLADACSIPLASNQFDVVVGFLVDPFFGLDCVAEAYRMLVEGGRVLFTLPTHKWAYRLCAMLDIDLMSTRFVKVDTEERVVLPSLVHTRGKIQEMMKLCGFTDVEVSDHPLPETITRVSQDIEKPAQAEGMEVHQLPVIHFVRAKK